MIIYRCNYEYIYIYRYSENTAIDIVMNIYRCNYRLTIDKTINTVIVITIYILEI